MQVINKPKREVVLLDLTSTNKKKELVKNEVPDQFSWEKTQDPKTKEQRKSQDPNCKLHQNRFCSLQTPAWMNPMADDPERKRGTGQLDNFQGSPLLLAQDLATLTTFASCKGSQRPAWMNKDHLKNLRHVSVSKWRTQECPGAAGRLLSM